MNISSGQTRVKLESGGGGEGGFAGFLSLSLSLCECELFRGKRFRWEDAKSGSILGNTAAAHEWHHC